MPGVSLRAHSGPTSVSILSCDVSLRLQLDVLCTSRRVRFGSKIASKSFRFPFETCLKSLRFHIDCTSKYQQRQSCFQLDATSISTLRQIETMSIAPQITSKPLRNVAIGFFKSSRRVHPTLNSFTMVSLQSTRVLTARLLRSHFLVDPTSFWFHVYVRFELTHLRR